MLFLQTPREYQLDTGFEPKRWVKSFGSLDDLITVCDPRLKNELIPICCITKRQ